MPLISEQSEQYVFRTMHCAQGAQHYRVLLPHSVYHPMVLACRVCNGHSQLLAIGKENSYNRGVRKLSAGEQQLLYDVHEHGVAFARRTFAHEVRPWTQLSAATSKDSVDLLIFDQQPSAAVADMRKGLIVFYDGKQHRPWKSENAKQRDTDCSASSEAAAAGYCVLRISYKDAASKMQTLDAAWRARTSAGWIKVSAHWNYGAHAFLALPALQEQCAPCGPCAAQSSLKSARCTSARRRR